jgi:hypothetical protein
MIAFVVDRHASIFETGRTIHISFILRLNNRRTAGDDKIVIGGIAGALRPVFVARLSICRPGEQQGERGNKGPKDMSHHARLRGFLEISLVRCGSSAAVASGPRVKRLFPPLG